jgi:hypothetical protein
MHNKPQGITTIAHTTRRVEIETTSRCTARCVHCPREYLEPREMTLETFTRIAQAYVEYRAHLATSGNHVQGPVFIFSGAGEPLLNKLTPDFIALAKQAGFPTKMYSNASSIKQERISPVLQSGIDEVSISFSGIRPEEFSAITGGLSFADTLENVLAFHAAAQASETAVYVTYNAFDQLTSTDTEIHAFWEARGIPCKGPYAVWNRGGLLSALPKRPSLDTVGPVDLDETVWCERLKHYDTVRADGTFIYCCCTFGHSIDTALGNIHRDPLIEIHRRYDAVLREKDPLGICVKCLKPEEHF